MTPDLSTIERWHHFVHSTQRLHNSDVQWLTPQSKHQHITASNKELKHQHITASNEKIKHQDITASNEELKHYYHN